MFLLERLISSETDTVGDKESLIFELLNVKLHYSVKETLTEKG
jgi:hypothetical protein